MDTLSPQKRPNWTVLKDCAPLIKGKSEKELRIDMMPVALSLSVL